MNNEHNNAPAVPQCDLIKLVGAINISFEKWATDSNQGYCLAREDRGLMATYFSDPTEHAWRGYCAAALASPAPAPAVPRVEVCCLKFDTCRNQCVPLVDHLRGQIKELKAAPAVPQGVPAQEVIDAIEAWKSAWLKVPPFADRVNKATREAITISHNSLFLLLQSAQQAQRMPAACPTPTGCGPHGCHGACIATTPAPSSGPAQCVPYPTIDMGHGKWEVGAGKNGGLPCIAFGRNGTGNVGEPITTEPRQMSVEETFAVITFANVTGLDVLQDKVDQVREEFFPGTTPQFAATPTPAPAQERCHLRDCTGDSVDQIGEWRGECPYCKPAQEVGLTGPAVAWRMRDTGFRRPKYVYFDTKEQAVAHAAHLLQSRDDGHLTELTPLCEASTSTDLLDALRDNSWKLEPFEIPTGQGDADIGWRVVGFYMGKPKERTEATVYTDDPAAAIIAALRAKGGSHDA